MALEGGLDANRGGGIIAISVLFMVFGTVVFFLRYVAHRVADSPVFLEDWLMIPSYILMMGLCIDLLLCASHGDAGRHEAWILLNEPTAFVRFAQTLFAMEILYSMAIAIMKTSILLLYRRIFGVERWFRHFTWGLIVYVWLWALSETIVAIVQCTPVAYQWDKTLNGVCIDQLATYRFIPLPNVLHDVVLLALPTPMIWALQKVSRAQKIALTVVFLIGSFGCIASIIRAYYMFMLTSNSDQTWQVNNLIWTVAEPGSIFICACVPVLWPMVRRIFSLPSEPTRIEGKQGTTVLLPRGVWSWRRATPPPTPNNYDLELLHGVEAPEGEKKTQMHDHLYLGPIRYQIKQDPRLGAGRPEFHWDASRASPARAV
ncbi:hypothetical protein M406DRAFT_323664 [Cryphonectria parasitica EP155]|uniref:Rhodopsin domain-containing protein n=1 Tax=Cryphonectria parasitica (strain ATCC 38755 / EP155) TaxID=660469 RepID=A0A9P4XY82_CRYP1|nr:uncharacterized protein M406DRAFT_323664 [Cryphonectria parasitica EP155]KAF3762720.1 hypothetical protein M406DRAFT_323664 [Cryphonectria parasitica EP155]